MPCDTLTECGRRWYILHLQVFFNIDELRSAVDGLISRYAADVEKAFRSATDGQAIGAPSSGAGSLLGVPGGARALSGLGQQASGSWQVGMPYARCCF